jgi:hypothetical protein
LFFAPLLSEAQQRVTVLADLAKEGLTILLGSREPGFVAAPTIAVEPFGWPVPAAKRP